MRGPGGAGLVRGPGLHGSPSDVPTKQNPGSARADPHRRQAIERAELLTGDEVVVKTGAMVTETEGSELGESPGPDVELLRG